MKVISFLLATRLRGVMFRLYTWLGHAGDRLLNVRTEDEGLSHGAASLSVLTEPFAGARYADSHRNQASAYWTIHYILHQLELQSSDVLVDVGCGSGRVICVAARRKLKRVVGIELLPEVADQARNNLQRLRGRKTLAEVICSDAATLDLSFGTVYYLANPFGSETLVAFLEALRQSLVRDPRRIQICYVSPRSCDVMEACGFLRIHKTLKTLGGSKVVIWHSVLPDQARLSSPPE